MPEWLGQLRDLQALYLDHNQLTAVPGALGQLTNLRELDLQTNEIMAVPESLGQLTNLQVLELGENQLRSVPETLGQLTNLQTLHLFNNQLTALSETFGNLANLRQLRLEENKLTALPDSFSRLVKLERLFLHGNPGLGLPEEVLAPTQDEIKPGVRKPKHPAEILGYYFRVRPPAAEVPSGSKPVPEGRSDSKPALEAQSGSKPVIEARPASKPVLEARIVVIGDGASGKSSLVRQLLHGLPAREQEPSTRDVVIEDWTDLELERPQTGEKRPVSVHIWDLGGQRQMHAAHPYFFTTRTLYLVVAEARKDQQDRVDYWLKMVAKYGDTARALVAINKADGHAMALDRPKLLDRYRKNLPEDASAAFYATSCTQGTGIQELKAGLVRELRGMQQIWALWPWEWFRVKDAIAELRHPKRPKTRLLRALADWLASSGRKSTDGVETMHYDEWRGICNQCGLTTEKDRDDLLENLGHLGHVVCFPHDPRLSQLGVLNPDWVTRGIYPLLADKKIGEKGGLLEMEDLTELLPGDRYPKDRHPWLVDLMKAFELLFEDGRGRLLLPGQLPADSPPWAQPAQWSDPGTLHLELRYDRVLPESVISQFIVRRHQEARSTGEWWRHGIALKRGACEALVRAHVTEQEARIELRLRGPRQERRDFLTSIRETLRDPKDLLPPELHVILGKDSAPQYKDLLLLADKKLEHDFIIDGHVKTIQLAEVLDMVETPAEQAASRRAAVSLQVNIDNKPDMSTKNYGNITSSPGAVQGDGSQSNIAGSFNTQGTDAVALVAALRRDVAKLQATQAAKVRKHVEVIEAGVEAMEAEKKKPEPRKGFLELTGKGLVEAAKACGEAVPSLLKSASAVAEWYSKTF